MIASRCVQVRGSNTSAQLKGHNKLVSCCGGRAWKAGIGVEKCVVLRGWITVLDGGRQYIALCCDDSWNEMGKQRLCCAMASKSFRTA